MALPTSDPAPLLDVLVVADACLVSSHRMSEWVSSAPTMEEDVALGNIALDLLGQARGLLSHLGDEDQLAYFREAQDFRNPTICELPNGDFGHTMLRALFIDVWLERVWRRFSGCNDEVVRGVAEKAIKENSYHRRHSTSWVVRLGDGTEESHRRILESFGMLWPYCQEIAVDGWFDEVASVLTDATLPVPAGPPTTTAALGSRGQHTVHLTELLNESQSLARAHPGASW
jgi:ring-1,2-phenylacetyl-CoA epoxidase subunit PaaC